MARIRTIKPEFWSSEQIVRCCMQARLLFIGMWNFADDNGVFPKSFHRLKMQIFPGDDCNSSDLNNWICELLEAHLILEFTVGQDGYWLIIGFKRHQKIDKPTAKYPLPNNIADHSLSRIRGLVENSSTYPLLLDDSSSKTQLALCEVSNSSHPRNGKEGNVMEIGIGKVPEETLPDNVVSEIFNYWRNVLKHPKAKLDSARERNIIKAIKLGFSVAELKQAIDGCSKSLFHMGQNDHKRKYDEINLIFRNSEKIEMFIDLSSSVNTSGEIVSQIDQVGEGAI